LSQSSSASWSVDQFVVSPQKNKVRFHDFGLKDSVMQAVHALGYQYCSPIQAQSLPHTLAGHDVLGRAQTGTGKTAAFLISVVEDLLATPTQEERYAGEARALILAPTRELVVQIAEDAKALTAHAGLSVHTVVGGMDYNKQKQKLHHEFVDILVATPGRLIDFCESGDVYLDHVEVLVIDEADRMLDMGFIPQMRRIVRLTPRKTHRQTMMFSATFSYDVLNLADQWMHEVVKVEIEKFTILYNILQRPGVETLIAFANRRDECRALFQRLRAHGIKAGLLSGDIDQGKRLKTLQAFKDGQLQVLVATDVAGRGIHINDVSHVVNFTLPEEPEDYVHRIGRTGRAGAKGESISFACEDDAFRLPAIESLLGKSLECTQPPETLLKPEPFVDVPKEPRQHRRPKPRSGGRPSRPRRR